MAAYALGDLGGGSVNCFAFGMGKAGAGIGVGCPTNTARRCTGGGLLPNIIPPESVPNRAAGYCALTRVRTFKKS